MKKILCFAVLSFSLLGLGFSQGTLSQDDCVKDVKDKRGVMKPWKKGSRYTGRYRNVFREAGYRQADIDAKLAKAYYDVFEGPDKVYFEVGDSMAYVTDMKNHDIRSEGLSYGLMVAVQLNKKGVFDRIWRYAKEYMQHHSFKFYNLRSI